MKQILPNTVFVLLLFFSHDVCANLPLKAPMYDNYEVIVYLNDGRTIEGVLLQRTEEHLLLETDFGEITIRSENVERIELKGTSEKIPQSERREIEREEIRNPELESEVAMIGRAMVYESRKKNIGTAIGFEALGAGLLYAERYTAGSIMLLAQTGLIIGSIFAPEPELQLGLGIAALALKGTNLFFTIRAVNRYNQNLMYDLGLQERPIDEARPYVVPSGAGYLELGGKGLLSINAEYRLYEKYLVTTSFGYLDRNRSFGLMLHRIFGANRSKLEIGAGFTNYKFLDNSESIFNPLIGYRYESKGSLLFRVNATTFVPEPGKAYAFKQANSIGFPIIGLSFGYSF